MFVLITILLAGLEDISVGERRQGVERRGLDEGAEEGYARLRARDVLGYRVEQLVARCQRVGGLCGETE